MFIYIGNDLVIESKQILAIFEIDLVNHSKRLSSIVKKSAQNDTLLGSKEDAKSVIITDDHVYYSPLSTLTLKNRDELYQTIS